MPAMFHTASIWLTLALAVQRYIYVCHAPVARTFCTMPRVTKGLLYIGITAGLHQSTRFVDRDYKLVHLHLYPSTNIFFIWNFYFVKSSVDSNPLGRSMRVRLSRNDCGLGET